MSEVQELEKQREDFKKLIHKRDLVLKLQKLNAFKELILDEYCTKECARYVGVAGDPAISKEDRELPETELHIDSINDGWKHLKYMNFEHEKSV